MHEAHTAWPRSARASSSAIMRRARCRDEAPRRPCEEVDENALVEEQFERAEGAVPSELRSVVPSASHSRHLIGGPRSEEICTVQTGGQCTASQSRGMRARPAVHHLCVDAIEAAAHDSSPQRWRAPPASGSAQQRTIAAWSSLEQLSHTSQRSTWAGLFTPELKDQLELDQIIRHQIA